jgi:glycosyltransferase involved in cell wall biosynthesis
MPRVAIITRTLDRPVLLERALASIMAQTFTDWHWVVVDSGAGDSVAKLLKSQADGLRARATHLRFVNPHPGMRGIPINAGIAASDSELIILLDDDDTWEPRFLDIMVRALDRRPSRHARGVVCRTLCIEESSVANGLKQIRTWELNSDLCNVTLPGLAIVNRFCTHSFMYERDALKAVGLYPEDYPVLEDWHFNLRFVLHHEILVVPQTLTNYHLRPPEVDEREANSQTAGLSEHKFHEARLINEALRRDFQAGHAGLGHLLAQAALTRQLTQALHTQESRLKTISEKTGKIDTRTKELKNRFLPGR